MDADASAANINWEMWLGRAPLIPFNPERLEKNWFDCIRNGGTPFANIELAIRSHTVICLAETAEQFGRKLKPVIRIDNGFLRAEGILRNASVERKADLVWCTCDRRLRAGRGGLGEPAPPAT
jgi:hypothetical protein